MPEKLPLLTTDRLMLRPFTVDDVDRVTELVGDKRVSEYTLAVPHPYSPDMAEEWISTHAPQFNEGAGLTLAVTFKNTGELIGAIGLTAAPAHRRAELGYWMGLQYWDNGYCTEAARAMLGYGFTEMKLHRIHANHSAGNPASGRVMQKIGMQHEGRRPDHVFSKGRFHTVELYGVVNPADASD